MKNRWGGSSNFGLLIKYWYHRALIYRAYNQWEAKKLWRDNLKVGTLLLVDDYQHNLTVELGSTPTSSAYGANQTNVTFFPVVLYYRKEGLESISKASITFYSDDPFHVINKLLSWKQGLLKLWRRRQESTLILSGVWFETLFIIFINVFKMHIIYNFF